jgi:hypothetical protein
MLSIDLLRSASAAPATPTAPTAPSPAQHFSLAATAIIRRRRFVVCYRRPKYYSAHTQIRAFVESRVVCLPCLYVPRTLISTLYFILIFVLATRLALRAHSYTGTVYRTCHGTVHVR